jgi:hypothetical protein
MDTIVAVTLLSFVFVIVFFRENIQRWLFHRAHLGRVADNPDSSENRFSAPAISSKSVDCSDAAVESKVQSWVQIGCYLASNDDKDLPVYAATPLQDIDPKDLA